MKIEKTKKITKMTAKEIGQVKGSVLNRKSLMQLVNDKLAGMITRQCNVHVGE